MSIEISKAQYDFMKKTMDALGVAAKEYRDAADCSKCKMSALCNKAYVDFPEYFEPCEEVIKRHWMHGEGNY